MTSGIFLYHQINRISILDHANRSIRLGRPWTGFGGNVLNGKQFISNPTMKLLLFEKAFAE